MSMLWKPHFVFALIVQISTLWLFLTACEEGKWTKAVGAGCMALLLGFTHAFHLITIYLIAIVFSFLWSLREKTLGGTSHVRWRPLLYAAILIGISAPSLLYLSYLVRISPVMAAWQKQNVNLSPPVWCYLLGFGPTALVILCCPRQFLKQFLMEPLQKQDGSPRNLFLLVWVVCNSLLLYSAPLINFERRLVQGLQIPLAIVSVQLFSNVIYPRIIQSRFMQQAFEKGILSRQTSQGTLCLIWLLSGTPTTLYHFTSTSYDALPPRSPYYLSPAEQQAAAYLSRNSDENAVILAPEKDGSWLPYMTERHVFVGHPVQTLNYLEKSRLAKRFFSGQMNVAEGEQLLKTYPAHFIYWPVRKNQHMPPGKFWTKVLDTPQIQVFQLTMLRSK